MSAYNQEGVSSDSPAYHGLSPELGEFYKHLAELLNHDRPELSSTERRWLSIFKEIATCFDGVISRDDSYWLSFESLYCCQGKDKARYDKYVKRACYRKHLDHLKRRRWTFPLRGDHAGAGDYQTRVDARLDLEEALGRLGAMNRRWETVIRMRYACHTYDEIATALGVTARHAIRLAREAERRLRGFLTGYGDENAYDD
jgi:hypothetical protein